MKVQQRKGFTIVELVIVIAVIAILAAVLIPTFSGIIDNANRSKAMQEAKNAWNDVSYTYTEGFRGFAAANTELNGWYYDYEDGVAKYTVDNKYTVTYDGENFVVNDLDGSAWVWDAITTSSESSTEYTIGSDPYALRLTYYTDIFSRGFAWVTQSSVTVSQLYVVASTEGKDADFSGAALITGSNDTSRGSYYTSHKAYITGLTSNTVYSYKVGSSAGWKYGTFKTEQSTITEITAIQLSDAQTKDPTKLYVWENTMAQAIETAGHGLDMILYNGDQLDSNQTSTVDRGVRYAIARETVDEYVGSIPYMASSGNHEPANGETYMHTLNNTIDYGVDGVADDGMLPTGGYYSYDYGFAHFVVLNSNDTSDTQKNWLISDLKSAQTAKWIIVVMHIGAYATGDHSNGVSGVITTYTPIFSQYHVDLVLQAHDHTYNKTLPYKWDAAGYTTTYENNDVVNFNVQTTTYNGETYDLNPNGTYYVTTGAAGHRVGSSEGDAGIWADVTGTGMSSQLSPLYSGSTFLNNTYKIEVGEIAYSNTYSSFDCSSPSYSNDQVYNAGDPATGNVNAQMFGVLNLTETTLTYDFYTVEGNEVTLFDSLNVMKN